jgi:uncharacterized membrane protein
MALLYALLALWPVAVTVALVLLWAKVSDPRARAEIARLRAEVARLSAEIGRLHERLAAGAPGADVNAKAAEAEEPPPVVAPSPVPEAPAAPPFTPPSYTVYPPEEPFASVRPRQGWQPPRELEALIGGNWLLKIGILAIVLGALYFIKYAFENRWIDDTGRVLIGAFAGIALIGAGELFHRRGYARYGHSVGAGGICILYLSIYAAFNFYTLIGNAPALALMALVTAAGALLAARYPSKTLAVLSLLGGIMTPYWLSTGQNNEGGLLTYLLILDVGMGLLAHAKGWRFLNWISLVGTVALFGAWASEFYTRSAAGLTELFLVLFAVLYVGLAAGEPARDAARKMRAPLAAVVLVLLFFASEANLEHIALWYWVFIDLFAAAAAGWTLWRREWISSNGAFVLIVAGVAGWFPDNYRDSDAHTVALLATVAFGIFLAQQVLGSKWEAQPSQPFDVIVTLSTGFAYFGVIYRVLRPEFSDSMGLAAVALSLLYLALVRAAEAPVSYALLGASISFVTLAIPIQLDSSWITLGWAAEAVVLCWIGFEGRAIRLRQAGLAVLALSLTRLLAWDALTIWRVSTLLFNRRALAFVAVIAAAYLVAMLYRRNPDGQENWERPVRTLLILLASAVTVIMISLENWSYSDNQLRSGADDVIGTRNSRQMLLSILWGTYSIGAVLIGFNCRYRPIRLFGIALFFLAIAKVFTVDIWLLQRLYRIISVITLGCLLLGVAFLYQRFSRSGTEPSGS